MKTKPLLINFSNIEILDKIGNEMYTKVLVHGLSYSTTYYREYRKIVQTVEHIMYEN